MSRKRKLINKRPVTDSERWRIEILADYGLYYSTIAKRLYGSGKTNYSPTAGEITRVGRIARQQGASSLFYRKGENKESTNVINSVLRTKQELQNGKIKMAIKN